ncbi:Os08g0482700 [Oryza sativa Japonica Group]|uniref:Os08g0482700 protein n=2 Tax=Oryza sativa subsp. japonica TaxID=39947 RepID=Q6ZFF0_ORYSJ|nr:hypothetical protein EE612_044962 [Oryza sativa]BAD09293.1 unknown protein [Oryza sativa Japonica Group]BAT05941.1 Os08g0482700 [Oryza sativa Japonica Group]
MQIYKPVNFDKKKSYQNRMEIGTQTTSRKQKNVLRLGCSSPKSFKTSASFQIMISSLTILEHACIPFLPNKWSTN